MKTTNQYTGTAEFKGNIHIQDTEGNNRRRRQNYKTVARAVSCVCIDPEGIITVRMPFDIVAWISSSYSHHIFKYTNREMRKPS
jgi:hypothetical protein